jgi:hypothetical protein
MSGLYHYTCDHGHGGIQRDGWVKPGPDGLVWLTDLPPGRKGLRKALGLTSHMLDCDRMQYVFRVERSDRVFTYAEAVRRGFISRARSMSLVGPHSRPANWYVAIDPVAVLDPEEAAS